VFFKMRFAAFYNDLPKYPTVLEILISGFGEDFFYPPTFDSYAPEISDRS